MPAMPMAESKPPMVVGIRQTNSATSTSTRHRAAGIGGEARDGDDREEEDERQAGEQDVERDLVRRLLPLRALDQGDHAVEEGRARLGGDAHLDPVGEHLRAAGDRRAVAAAFADDRRGLAGDRRFVDRGDALDDLAVGRDEVAGLDQHDVAACAAGSPAPSVHLVADDVGQPLGDGLGLGLAQGLGLRLAAAFGHRLGEVGEQHREPEPERDLDGEAQPAVRR